MNDELEDDELKEQEEILSKYRSEFLSNKINVQLALTYEKNKRWRLVLENVGLVHYGIKKYFAFVLNGNRRADSLYNDMFNIGIAGLYRATKTFNIKKGKFSTYAIPWIRQYINRQMTDNYFTNVRLPVFYFDKLSKLKQKCLKQKKYKFDNDDTLLKDVLKLINKNDITLIRAISVILNKKSTVYLDKDLSQASNNGDCSDAPLLDYFLICDDDSIRTNVYLSDLKNILTKCMKTLSDKEKTIIEMRFGMNGYEPHTLEECTTKFKVTREMIRQIQNKALRKIRKKIEIYKIYKTEDVYGH